MLKWREYIKKNIFFGFSLFFSIFWIFWKYIKNMGQKLGSNKDDIHIEDCDEGDDYSIDDEEEDNSE